MAGYHGVTWGLAQSRKTSSRFTEFTRLTRLALFCIHAGESTFWTGFGIYKQIRRNRVNPVNRVMIRPRP